MMEIKGRLASLYKDIVTGKIMLTFECDQVDENALQEVTIIPALRITLKKWREKRSLNANAYAWVLITKIANVLRTSKEEVYELMLFRYGQIEEGVVVTVKRDVDMQHIDGHWMLIKKSDKWAAYQMIRGSSTYNTEEMSIFIDGIVSECKELHIETLTPAELERMKQEWHIENQ